MSLPVPMTSALAGLRLASRRKWSVLRLPGLLACSIVALAATFETLFLLGLVAGLLYGLR